MGGAGGPQSPCPTQKRFLGFRALWAGAVLSGWHVLNVGGNWNNTTNAGLFYFNANNTTSTSNTNIGSRQLVLNLQPRF